MSEMTQTTAERLRILQINLNKSPNAQLDLINNVPSGKWDIVLVQEPNITFFTNIRTPNQFTLVTPASRFSIPSPVRSAIWMSSCLLSNAWKIINIPDTNNITAVQLSGAYGRLTIFNIYNPSEHNDVIAKLHSFMVTNRSQICSNPNDFVMWCRDFNRHHPLWDRDEDERLFTNEATLNAEFLISRLAEWNMDMPLPKGIPTLKHMVSKLYSRPDNVFCTDNLTERVVKCNTRPDKQPPKTDHFPIVTVLDLTTKTTAPKLTLNFTWV
jgi:hypothetical protein